MLVIFRIQFKVDEIGPRKLFYASQSRVFSVTINHIYNQIFLIVTRHNFNKKNFVGMCQIFKFKVLI